MKKIIIIIFLAGSYFFSHSQKIELLNQKNEFKNVISFSSDGSLTTPAGVTRIMVEMWGGGAGGSSIGGGGGGGYLLGIINIDPGSVIQVRVGTAGTSRTFDGVITATDGGESQIYSQQANSSFTLRAWGGRTFKKGNLNEIIDGKGGDVTFSHNFQILKIEPGEDGEAAIENYHFINNQTVGITRFFGKGGNAGGITNSGGRGAVFQNMNLPTKFLAKGTSGKNPGGGGGGGNDSEYCKGAAGHVKIYY